jgi:hypothetical protein
VRAEFFGRLRNLLQRDQPGPAGGVELLQTDSDENPVLAGERHDVGNGAERDQVQQRFQIKVGRAGQTGFATAFDKSVGEFEGKAGGAKLMEIADCRLPIADYGEIPPAARLGATHVNRLPRRSAAKAGKSYIVNSLSVTR